MWCIFNPTPKKSYFFKYRIFVFVLSYSDFHVLFISTALQSHLRSHTCIHPNHALLLLPRHVPISHIFLHFPRHIYILSCHIWSGHVIFVFAALNVHFYTFAYNKTYLIEHTVKCFCNIQVQLGMVWRLFIKCLMVKFAQTKPNLYIDFNGKTCLKWFRFSYSTRLYNVDFYLFSFKITYGNFDALCLVSLGLVEMVVGGAGLVRVEVRHVVQGPPLHLVPHIQYNSQYTTYISRICTQR